MPKSTGKVNGIVRRAKTPHSVIEVSRFFQFVGAQVLKAVQSGHAIETTTSATLDTTLPPNTGKGELAIVYAYRHTIKVCGIVGRVVHGPESGVARRCEEMISTLVGTREIYESWTLVNHLGEEDLWKSF